MGRPTIYNEQRADAIVEAIKKVGFAHIAAEINGIHRNTLTAWLERGDNGEEPYASFADRFRQAKSEWQSDRVGEVRDPTWLLERSDPTMFKRQDEVKLSGNIALELAELEGKSTDEIKEALREVLNEGRPLP